MLAIRAVAERGRLGPTLFFVFIWTTLVYDPIACWTWNAKGWAKVLRVLDFAGGTPVHISSGSAALAIWIFFGPRPGFQMDQIPRGHNTSYIVLGTALMWFGWFGFNGGESFSTRNKAQNTDHGVVQARLWLLICGLPRPA
jgi:ammonium transporter, Amt family